MRNENGIYGSFRVLVVHEDRDIAQGMEMILKECGFEARAAHDAEDALAVAANFMPHVAILDVCRPELDGLELGRRLKQEICGNELVMIAVTDSEEGEFPEQCEKAGFEHRMVKPVHPSLLVKLLDYMRSQRARGAASQRAS